MGKPVLEDIVKKKSVPKVRERREPFVRKVEPVQPPPYEPPRPEPVPSGERSGYLLWTIAFISIGILLLGVSFLLSKARVEVFPKTQAVTLNDNFAAEKSPSDAPLVFDIIVLSGEENEIIEATEEKDVTERAKGTVVIFNSYSTSTQRLDIDTRLLGSNGKLYKTSKAITVPGAKADGTPGSIEVGIYASEPSEEYNSGPLDFNIVGFQGTPKYEKFSVRSKAGTSLSGGYRGKTLVATEEDKANATQDLKTRLNDKLFKKAVDQIPEGFILFPGAAAFVVDEITIPPGVEELKATMQGTLYGIILNKAALAQEIAKKKISTYEKSDIYIPNLKTLKFTLGPVGEGTLGDMTQITFNLTGDTEVVGKLDEEKFAADLLGRSKKDFASILSGYPNIDRAELSLSPVWRRDIPDEPQKLKVIVNYPKED